MQLVSLSVFQSSFFSAFDVILGRHVGLTRGCDFAIHKEFLKFNGEQRRIIEKKVVASSCHGSKISGWQQMKTSLKKKIRTVSNLISFNLSNVGEIFWVEFEGTVSKITKTKRKFWGCAHLLDKPRPGEWNYDVSCRSSATTAKKCTKKCNARQSCSFANLNLLLFCCCKESLLLWSRNFATIVTWRHTSPLCWHYNQNKLDTWGWAPLNGGI